MDGFLLKWVVMPFTLLAVGFGFGWQVHGWRYGAQQAQAVGKVVRVVQQQAQVNQPIVQRIQYERDRTVYVNHYIHDKVPIYVTAEVDRQCVVPLGFVRVHDGAANDVPPVPFAAGESADTASGIALSTVATTVADNYATCHDALTEAQAWRDWYVGQAKAFQTK